MAPGFIKLMFSLGLVFLIISASKILQSVAFWHFFTITKSLIEALLQQTSQLVKWSPIAVVPVFKCSCARCFNFLLVKPTYLVSASRWQVNSYTTWDRKYIFTTLTNNVIYIHHKLYLTFVLFLSHLNSLNEAVFRIIL